jgi:hypothetical protein
MYQYADENLRTKTYKLESSLKSWVREINNRDINLLFRKNEG